MSGEADRPEGEVAEARGTEPWSPAGPDGGAGDGQAREDRLAAEHRLDEVSRYEHLPEDELGVAAPPRSQGVSRRTRVLAAGLAASLCFLAGIQCQKLVGAGGSDAPTPRPGAAMPEEPGTGAEDGPATSLARGEILAIRGSALYIRASNGSTIKVNATPGSQVTRGRRVPLDAVRPGEPVLIEAREGEDGRLEAISISVLPPRSRR